MENNKLLSIGETAKLLGVSIQTLRRWDDKGILKSFRATPNGNRFYKSQDINLFTNDLSTLGWKWASDVAVSEPPSDFYCATSDVFTTRLKRLENDLQKIDDLGIHHSLLTSMVGEIGDNSYAHNLGNWPDILGIFFAYDLNKREIVLADRGRGILKTLKPVRPELQSHKEALEVAFTKIISGRFPERRGNGLKSVARNILTSNVKLIFRTGNAQLDLERGDKGMRITECLDFHGCYAVFKF
ncbi:MAG: helix-turn-helix domain-containing protein [Candidatus Gracilibacteria bacterium]